MPARIHGDNDARGARLDFSVNVLAARAPEWLREALGAELDRLGEYPAQERLHNCEELIAEQHGVLANQVLLTAGAAEAFSLLTKLGIQRPTIIHPGFSEPDDIFSELGLTPYRQIMDAPFDDLSTVAIPADSDCVIVGNPTNPTGVLHSPADLLSLIQGNPHRYLVVDEAFMDVVPERGWSLLEKHAGSREEYERVIVIRSLTKTWSLAGLRVGYLIAYPKIIAQLNAGRSHWPLGSMQLAAIEAISAQPTETLERIRAAVATDRVSMVRELKSANFKVVTHSHAPYLLVKPPVNTENEAEILRQYLLREQRIAVRRCDTFPGLDFSYWRLAVRSPEQVADLIDNVRAGLVACGFA